MNQPLAYIHPGAKISKNVVVEPFTTIHNNVIIGDGTWIGSNVTIMEGARIGKNCNIFPGAVISAPPQDLKYDGEDTTVTIGNNTTIRECATIHKGTSDRMKTVIGKNCLIMAYCHIAHDCLVGNNTVFVNNAVIGGHVEIGDFVYLGGQSAVHQFCRIGKHAIVGAGTTIDGDVIPYTSVIGSRGHLSGLNLVGLRRRSFNKDDIKKLRNVYRLLFAPEGTFNERLYEVSDNYKKDDLIKDILVFLEDNSNRPLIHPRMDKF